MATKVGTEEAVVAKPESKKPEKAHGKSAYFKSQAYLDAAKFRRKVREANKFHSRMDMDFLKDFCGTHSGGQQGKKYVDGEVSELFTGVITREKGWIKDLPGYRVCCIGNSVQDWAIISFLLIILYIFYACFFFVTYYLYQIGQDTLLWIYFAMMIAFMTSIGCLVGKGYLDADAQEEDERKRKEMELYNLRKKDEAARKAASAM
jgi:hypothetical protein